MLDGGASPSVPLLSGMVTQQSEADTRAKLIDPALHARGWTEDLIRREETAGPIVLAEGGARKLPKGRIDYTLRVRVTAHAQPVALALIEAKAQHLPATHGLEQAKLYSVSKRLNVQFVFSTNGHQYVEYDRTTGKTDGPFSLTDFPAPAALRARYERAMGFRSTPKPRSLFFSAIRAGKRSGATTRTPRSARPSRNWHGESGGPCSPSPPDRERPSSPCSS